MTSTESLLIGQLPDVCEGEIRLPIPVQFRRGQLANDERESINSAIWNLKGIATKTERPDWTNLDVLDFGCGVKFTQALVQYRVPVGNYVGMDVHQGLIQCLKERVNRPNFQYYDVPFHNAMYNKGGVPLTRDAELPGNIKQYDLFTLQSVFTHFAPADFLALLHVLRRYAAPNSRMLFTCLINNDMETDFLDAIPESPLLNAYYKEGFIREMIAESGWKALSLSPPDEYWMMDSFVCAPA